MFSGLFVLFFFWYMTVPFWNLSFSLFCNMMELGAVRDPEGYDKVFGFLAGGLN